MIKLFNDDANNWMVDIETSSVDLIITDPPYDTHEEYRAIGTTTRLKRWFPVEMNEYFLPWFYQAYRVLKENTHCYVFCSWKASRTFEEYGKEAGFTLVKPLIWDKVNRGTGYPYAAQYEVVLLFSKGKRKTNTYDQRDVLSFKSVRTKGHYPTEKPLALMEVFVTESSNKGEIVIDPFMGSGVVGEACLKHDRYFMGNDKEKMAYDYSEDRLLTSQLSWQ